MSIEAMKQALDALENVRRYDTGDFYGLDDEITALRQVIEQAEKQDGWVLREVLFDNGEPIAHRDPVQAEKQEPVAWEYTTSYVPNPDRDNGIRVTNDLRVAEVNALPGSIKPLGYAAPVHASDISQKPDKENKHD